MATPPSNSEARAEAMLNVALNNDALHSLDRYLDSLPLLILPLSSSTRHQLATCGARLWNTSTQMISGAGNIDTVKAFAFLMLECAAPTQGLGSYRVLETALKTVKSCTEHRLLELSQEIIEIAAIRLDRLVRSENDSDKVQIQSVSTEYYLVRVYLAWLQGRSDIADHLFLKIPKPVTTQDQKCIIELCSKIGISALDDCHYDTAAKWLERAQEACEAYSNDTSQGGKTLHDDELLILHATVRANFGLKGPDAKECFHKALHKLKSNYGSVFAVKVLQLAAFTREGRSRSQECLKAYEELQVLRDIVVMLEPNEAELRTLVSFFQKIRDLDAEFYVQGLKQLLDDKLATCDKREWTERILITLIWTLTDSHLNVQNNLSVLCGTTKRLIECGQAPLSEDATNACLILIWKYIDVILSEENFCLAEQWCLFVLEEPMFQCSSINRVIFLKRFITCVSNHSNSKSAYKVFERMPEECKNCPSALYLMYKAALINQDVSQGQLYFRSLCGLGAAGREYLVPCAAEALRSGQTSLAADTLQQTIANLHGDCIEKNYISSLFIALVCLTSEEVGNSGNMKDEERVAQIISALEVALRGPNRHEQRTVFTATELEWLSKRSYQTAAQIHTSSDSRLVVRVLDLSIQVTCFYLTIETKLYMKVCPISLKGLPQKTTQSNRKQQKHYDDIHKSSQHFHRYFRYGAKYGSTSAQHSEWLQKHRVILSLNVECAVILNQWDRVSSIIVESKDTIDNELGSIFLDYVLRSGASVTCIVQVIKEIILVLCTSQSPYLDTAATRTLLPRYLHIFFQLSLDASDYPLAESGLDQALALALDNYKTVSRYPSDEIQWMATVAFNRAVDFYIASEEGDCRRWAEKAIELADLGEHECVTLKKLLRENYGKLS
ncbi:meiosis protein SPO22/ZIP4 like-domain-containing protein [Aspergillus leporis]|uniref:Meiosis protein SPO22/ZIP4 like-domain-containing protein n=1 Tax=Aspergillus leporis TaxID=41062 RepID=A0A5N5X598_9EURO|nr:meiosis protein SPO22/ZIP4 like-domain-containing protein [Aspergillus leporis]